MLEQEIQQALKVLRDEGTILYPSDTIWGIGCDATHEKAVEKISLLKKRNEAQRFISLVSDEAMLNRFVKNIPAVAWDLLDAADSPLTIIYDEPKGLAASILSDDGSAAIRIVKDEFCQRLIHKFGKPIVSTSANISGENTPQNFFEISEEIKNGVDYIINWRQDECQDAKPSSIIKLKSNGEFKIIRK
ncbi:MAG: threonylcarbamoyl-AMP synthase [Bacteroidetes bacterium]|nr:threonylcarbamoyl-AMP synthase [Bacteroidota bacterium]